MPLDPASPSERLVQILSQIHPKLALTSPSNSRLLEDVLTIQIDAELDEQLTRTPTKEVPRVIKVTPSDPAYVLFTSGSTGTPKGFVMEHRAVATSQTAIIKRLALPPDARIMQFASFVFDLSVGEIFTTLLSGRCLFVPSEEQRRFGIKAFIAENKISVAFLTPSFVRTLRPEDVPSLELLLLAGEAVGRDILDVWFGKVRLVNGWGPAETCVFSSLHEWKSITESPATIGKSVACAAWVIHLEEADRLAPVGVTGEIVLQGPTLLREYLGLHIDSITKIPAWVPRRGDCWERFYRTGDMGFYNADGTIEFAGRKDTQVKIRGQKVELGEVEYHVREASTQIEDVAVDILRPTSSSQVALVAYVSMRDTQGDDAGTELQIRATDDQSAISMDIIKHLRSKLPEYMHPSYIVPVSLIPQTKSTKVNRRALLNLTSDLTPEELSSYSTTVSTPFRACTTDTEKQIRKIWSEVLGIPEDCLGADDEFFHRGGDSIQVVTRANGILESFGVSLGQRIINNRSITISSIAKLVDNTTAPDEEGDGVVDLRAEIDRVTTQLRPSLELLQTNQTAKLPLYATVFLTGATGYLGTEILRQLLHSDSVGMVIALVRANSIEHGLSRVKETAQIAGWWREEFANKLDIWTGDLAEHHLGLDDSQWSYLGSSHVHAVIHNGARVYWRAGYEELRSANVDSTTELLQQVSKSSAKMVFVSGGGRTDFASEDTVTDFVASTAPGYWQSKFVAESALNNVTKELSSTQNRLSVVKPGRIIGSAVNGVANVDDYIWRLVATAAALGVYPIEPEGNWTAINDVGAVAAIVVEQVLDTAIEDFIDVSSGLSVPRFWEALNEELCCEGVSWEEWTLRAKGQMKEVGSGHPLWPVQHYIGQVGVPSELVMSKTTRGGDESRGGRENARIKEALGENVRYLRRVGYISAGGIGIGGLVEKVIGRS